MLKFPIDFNKVAKRGNNLICFWANKWVETKIQIAYVSAKLYILNKLVHVYIVYYLYYYLKQLFGSKISLIHWVMD